MGKDSNIQRDTTLSENKGERLIMKLTDYLKRGYGRTNNKHGKNQGVGVINNPKGHPETLVRGGRWKARKEQHD